VAQSDLAPAAHAICYGAFEARRFFTQTRVASGLAAIGDPPLGQIRSPPFRMARRLGSVGVCVNSNGNAFMREIAGDLVNDLLESGVRARLLNETSSPLEHHDIVIFVAPHEFFTLAGGAPWMRDTIVRNAFMFATEQVQTAWFAQSLPFIFMSRGVIDMSFQAAGLFRATGLPAIEYLPGAHRPADGLRPDDRSHALFRGLPSAAKHPPDGATAFADRPIDIAFLGTESPRRNAFFSANNERFGAFATCLYLRPGNAGPIKLAGDDAPLTRLAAHISGQTKITLNIHQEEIPYFEWHRLVRLGMASGSIVVSEPCARQRGFEPGVHYLEAEANRIPELVAWLLRSPDGRATGERVSRNAIAVTSDRRAARREVGRLCRFLAEHVRP
jgi:hypothetical protein